MLQALHFFVDSGTTLCPQFGPSFESTKTSQLDTYCSRVFQLQHDTHFPVLQLYRYLASAAADSFSLILLNMSTIAILTADIPVLNGNAQLPSPVIGFIHS
jgi:hypothetical protein